MILLMCVAQTRSHVVRLADGLGESASQCQDIDKQQKELHERARACEEEVAARAKAVPATPASDMSQAPDSTCTVVGKEEKLCKCSEGKVCDIQCKKKYGCTQAKFQGKFRKLTDNHTINA